MNEEGLYALQNAWRLAMQREQDAFDFYSKLAHEGTDAGLKALFTELAQQEAEHKARLVREYRRIFESDLDGPNALSGGSEGQFGDGIAWMEWSEDTFRLAQELDLPILLNISAAWCRWCRLMDQLSYADTEIASLINGEFIPIRVDNDRRPDINVRYNMGGWPTTAILTPGGETITGRTYVPAEEMLRFLRQGSEYYHVSRDGLKERLQHTEGERRKLGHWAQAAGPISLEIVDEIVNESLQNFDRVHGGFGDAPKLPNADPLELALAVHYRTDNKLLRRSVELTLTNMATGGMYDQEMGGFFRYSTTKDWTVPQFEKMLKDNAKLLRVYLQAYQAFGRDLYEQTARKTLDYINSTLYDETQGIFYSSQAADDQYYNLSLEDRQNVKAPWVDKTVYTNSNAMSIVAYLESSVVLHDKGYARQAMQALDFLWRNAYEPGMGMFHCYDGAARVPGLLTDQVWMVRALLHGYQYAARPEYLLQAATLITECIYPLYADPVGLGYFDCVVDTNASGRLKEGLKNINENALVADVSTLLFRLTGEEVYRAGADSALSAFGAGYKTYSYFAARYALAIDRALRSYVALIVAGSTDDPQTDRLLQASLAVYAPNIVVQVVDPIWERDQLEAMGLPAVEIPVVHVCRGELVAEPVLDPAQVAAAVTAVSLGE